MTKGADVVTPTDSRPGPDVHDLITAAMIAPFAAPVVVAAWLFLVSTVGPHPVVSSFGTVAGTVALLPLLCLFALPVAYAMTFCLGLPAVLLWRRVLGRINAPSTVLLGAVLGVFPFVAYWPILLIAGIRFLALFASCGAATAATFWYIGLREA